MSTKPALETQHFGTFLRYAREQRELSLGWVSQVTKVSQSSLRMLENAELEDLPPSVFVRGFVRAYARAIGIPDAEPLELFDQMMAEIEREKAQELLPAVLGEGDLPGLGGPGMDDESTGPRRGVGLAIFVVIVLVLATITVSTLMRQQPAPGEGLSQMLLDADISQWLDRLS